MSASKWILGSLGFVLGGPIGALIGVFVASVFESGSKVLNEGDDFNPRTEGTSYAESGPYAENHRQRTASGRRTATVGDIRVSIIVLIACVIKADGRVMKSEVNYIKPFLVRNFGEEGAKEALQLLKQLLSRDIDPVAVSQQISRNVNYSTRLELLHMLLDLANADGDICEAERQVIELIAVNMGVSEADYQSISAMYRKAQDPDWAYTVLEIEVSATDDEVKRAYRRMAMKYHPDKVANAGEEIRQQATEKFRTINKAYEHIKMLRGLK